MTTTTPKTGRTHRSPEGGFASVGAVRQHGGGLPVYICNTCGGEVVWATAKTGRKYLANVRRGYLDQRYYIGADLHPRDCGERKSAALAEFEAAEAKKALARERTNKLQAMREAGATRDEILAELDTWD